MVEDGVVMKVKFDLNKFATPKNIGEVSIYKSIPIKYLELVRMILNSRGLRGRYVVRYRGRRPNPSYCLKSNANKFSIYSTDNYYKPNKYNSIFGV